jgi:pyruvate dehydrogenase E2 component (dihydrolipoamide acetyltransferase)
MGESADSSGRGRPDPACRRAARADRRAGTSRPDDACAANPPAKPAATPPPHPRHLPAPPARRPQHRRRGSGLASPAARRRAAEAGIDLAAVSGSGPGGAVLLADVERHAASRPAPAAEAPRGKPGLDMTEMRRAIAAAMTRAKREIPHYYLSHEIDLQAAQDG